MFARRKKNPGPLAYPVVVLGVLLSSLLPLAGCGKVLLNQPDASLLASRNGFDWRMADTARFNIYYEANSTAAAELRVIKQRAEASLDHVLEVLEETSYTPRITVFCLESPDRMRELIGWETNGISFYKTNLLCLVYGQPDRTEAVHELVHIVAMNAWGVPPRWINEGMAVYAGGSWYGNELDALAHAGQQQGELPSLEDLTRRFDKIPDRIGYPAAGSFVQMLIEDYGADKVKEIWQGGPGKLAITTGKSLAELESDWHVRIGRTETAGVTYDWTAVE